MADQTPKQVKDSINKALGNGADEQETPAQVLFAGVTQEQLDEWKAKYKEIHIITIKVDESTSITGYFKKPTRDIMANCVNLAQDKKVFEAREFLLLNTWIGGDKTITTNPDAAMPAQTKLWASLNFLTAEATKY